MTVIRFLWQRKRLYGVLFLGSSSIANYGSAAWYPEMLARNYGLSKTNRQRLRNDLFDRGNYRSWTVFGVSPAASRLCRRKRSDGIDCIHRVDLTRHPCATNAAEHIAGFVAHCFHKYDVLHHGGELSVDHAQ